MSTPTDGTELELAPVARSVAAPRLLDLFCCAGGAGWGYHLLVHRHFELDHFRTFESFTQCSNNREAVS